MWSPISRASGHLVVSAPVQTGAGYGVAWNEAQNLARWRKRVCARVQGNGATQLFTESVCLRLAAAVSFTEACFCHCLFSSRWLHRACLTANCFVPTLAGSLSHLDLAAISVDFSLSPLPAQSYPIGSTFSRPPPAGSRIPTPCRTRTTSPTMTAS